MFCFGFSDLPTQTKKGAYMDYLTRREGRDATLLPSCPDLLLSGIHVPPPPRTAPDLFRGPSAASPRTARDAARRGCPEQVRA